MLPEPNPPDRPSPFADESQAAAEAQRLLGGPLADHAIGAFVELCEATGLAERLTDQPDLTVFIPVDQAALSTLAAIEKEYADPYEGLVKFMINHVYARRVPVHEWPSGLLITADDEAIPVAHEQQELRIGSARVIGGPYEATNGLVYVLDGTIHPAGAIV